MTTNNWRRRYKRLQRAYLRAFQEHDADRMLATNRALTRLEQNP